MLQVSGLRQNVVELLGGADAIIEILHLATAGMPLPPAYQLFSGGGASHVPVGHSALLQAHLCSHEMSALPRQCLRCTASVAMLQQKQA